MTQAFNLSQLANRLNTSGQLNPTTGLQYANASFTSLGVGTSATGTTGDIAATGQVVAGFSDDRLKERIGNIENALEKLRTLNGFYFLPNEKAQELGYQNKQQVGVSAQEVQLVFPEIVSNAPIDNNYLTVQYEKLSVLIIEAIKQLDVQVQQLSEDIKKCR
jgi:trimeric autotransporter adhesin